MAVSGKVISLKELLEAQTHLWNHIFSFMNSFPLKTAIELGIPDIVHNHGKPITLTEHAAAASIPSDRLDHFRRLMTLLVHNGFFTKATSETSEPLYSLTKNSLLLIKEKGVSITLIIELVLYQPLLDPWQYLTSQLKSERPSSAIELCHGLFLWEATGKMPKLGKMMREGLDSDSGAVAKVIIQDCAYQFQGVKKLVEVARNKGKIALEIAQAFPQIKCSLLVQAGLLHRLGLDLIRASLIYGPRFEPRHGHILLDLILYRLCVLTGVWLPKCQKKKKKVQPARASSCYQRYREERYDRDAAGDMFRHIPPADVLILKWVLMTWNNEECVKILKRCKEAIPKKENGGKAIIIKKVMDVSPDGVHPKLTDVQLYFDMQMLVHLIGRQMTEAEWKKLFNEAGFKEYKIIPALGMRCIIEIYH